MSLRRLLLIVAVAMLFLTLGVYWGAGPPSTSPHVSPSSVEPTSPAARESAAESTVVTPESVPAPSIPEALAVLFGTVIDEEGRALAGRSLELARVQLGDWESHVLEEVHTTTDAHGGFRFFTEMQGVLRLRLLDEKLVADAGSGLLRGMPKELPDGATSRWVWVPRQHPYSFIVHHSRSNSPQGGRRNAVESAGARARVEVVTASGARVAKAQVALVELTSHEVVTETSDLQGFAEFSDLAVGSYDVVVESPLGRTPDNITQVLQRSLAAASRARNAWRIDEPGLFEKRVTLDDWAQIAGVVADEEGHLVAGVDVTCIQDSSTSVLTTDSEGAFSARVIPGEEYRLTVGQNSRRHQLRAFPALAPGESRLDHRIEITPPLLLRLHVESNSGEGVAEVHVTSTHPPGINFSSNMRDYAIGSFAPLTTDVRGWVEQHLVLGNWYLLQIRHRDYLPTAWFIDLRDGWSGDNPLEVRCVLDDLPAATIAGRVANGAGQGVADVFVRCREGSLKKFMGAFPGNYVDYAPPNVQYGVTDPEGRFLIRGVAAGVGHVLVLEESGVVTEVYEDIAGGATGLELLSEGPWVIEGVLVDDAGTPLAGVEVKAGAQRAQTDVDGHYSIIVEPTVSRVRFSSPDHVPQSIPGEELQQSPNLTLVARPRVQGELLGLDGYPLAQFSAYVECRSENRRRLFASLRIRTDDDGRFDVPWQGYQDPPDSMTLILKQGRPAGVSEILTTDYRISDQPVVLRLQSE